MKAVLAEAKKLVTPSKGEEKGVKEIVEDTIKAVNKAVRKSRVDAELIVGGSVGKGSWLPGIHDFDFFLLFDYDKYASKSEDLSNIAERVMSKAFVKYERVHGSRDYFQIKKGKKIIEIIPVLKLKKIQEKEINYFKEL